MIPSIISRIPELSDKTKVIDLYPMVSIGNENKMSLLSLPIKKKKIPTLFMVDSDDTCCHSKIKNLCRLNKYACGGILEFKKRGANRHGSIDRNGKILRLGNHHHTNETFKQLSLSQFSASKASTISYAIVISTKDDRAGSIAGLTYALVESKVKFEIEKATVNYRECWMCTKRLYKEDELYIEDENEAKPLKIDDKYWQYKTGYGEFAKKTNGVVKISMKPPGKQKEESMITKIINWILQQITESFNAIKRWFGYNQEQTKQE